MTPFSCLRCTERKLNWGSLVSILTRSRAGRCGVRIPTGAIVFSLLRNVHSVFGARTAFSSVVTALLTSPMCLHDVNRSPPSPLLSGAQRRLLHPLDKELTSIRISLPLLCASSKPGFTSVVGGISVGSICACFCHCVWYRTPLALQPEQWRAMEFCVQLPHSRPLDLILSSVCVWNVCVVACCEYLLSCQVSQYQC